LEDFISRRDTWDSMDLEWKRSTWRPLLSLIKSQNGRKILGILKKRDTLQMYLITLIAQDYFIPKSELFLIIIKLQMSYSSNMNRASHHHSMVPG
jgi:hypothetical protein